MQRYFLDTNVLVYAFDANAKKRAIAQGLIEGALINRIGVVSGQVVQEFLNVATRKFAAPMSEADAQTYLDEVLEPLCAVWTDAELIRQAIKLRARLQFSLYDSLIVAAALSADCATLYSEDLQAGQKIRGMTVTNPFED